MIQLPQLDRSNPNAFIGIVLLVALLVFVLPDRLPPFIASLSPDLFAGIVCARLPAAKDLAAHQSILGRHAQDPLQLTLAASEIGDDGGLTLRLSVTNNSLGTVPIVFQADNIAIAEIDGGDDGFGFSVRPAPAQGGRVRANPNPAGYSEGDIRLLGPRQSCLHAIDIVASAKMIDNGGRARARYRMTIAGAQQPQSEGVQPIYRDQGLDILGENLVQSAEIEIAPRKS